MSFWRQFDQEAAVSRSSGPQLTDETVGALESRYGVKFPKSLVELLKVQNGGTLADSGFKFGGEDYYVDSIYGLSASDQWGNIKPISEVFDLNVEEELKRQIHAEIGNPELVFPFADFGGHCLYALDYNQASPKGEPKIIYFVCEGELSAVRTIAESFEHFLNGHDRGEAAPSVKLDDIAKETVLLETTVAGQHLHGGASLEFSNWVCDRKNEVVIYTKSVWNRKVSLRRSVIPKRSLEPDFCEISKVEYVAEPAIYQLLLHVDPNRPLASVQDAEQSRTVWKNTKCELLYDSVYSHDQEQLAHLSRKLFSNYQGKPTSLTKHLNRILNELGTCND